jgi:hypothetical protein
MKRFAAVLLPALLAAVASADPNRLPQEEARAFAKLCVERAADLPDAQVRIDPDPDTPCAVRGEGGGAMIVPDRGLTAEKIRKAGKDVVPLGQLWLRKWTPVVGGKAVPEERLRIVTVRIDDKDRPMPLLLLGVRRQANGDDLELLVYAREAEPLLVVPLKKAEMGHDLPVELEWKRGEKDADVLTVNVLGRYQAVLAVARQGK